MNKSLVPGVVLLASCACPIAEAATAPVPNTHTAAPAATSAKSAKQTTTAIAPTASSAAAGQSASKGAAQDKKKPKKKKAPKKQDAVPVPVPVGASAAAGPTLCTADVAKNTILAGQSFMLTLTAAPSGTTGSKAYAITTPPQHGTLGSVSTNGQVEYTAADGYSGDDTFSYTVAKAVQPSVAIKICPVAVGDTWRALDSKSATTGTLIAKGSDLTYALVDKDQKPQSTLTTDHGSVTLYPRTGQFTYTPAPPTDTKTGAASGKATSAPSVGSNVYVGQDAFDFQVQSGTGTTALTSAKATETVILGSWPPCESAASYASRSVDALKQMVQPTGGAYNPDCIRAVTQGLRAKAFSLNKEIIKLQESRTQLLDDTALSANSAQIKSDMMELQQIEDLGVSPNDLLLDYRDYPNWYTYFFGGIAFTSIDKLFQNGSPVIGLYIDHRFKDWLHIAGVIEVTSAAESQLSNAINNQTSSTPTPAPSASTQSSGHNALDANVEPYFPWIDYGDATTPGHAGPIVLFGLRKRDGDSRFTYRRYLGIRDAINPDSYVDILFGQTMGLDGSRVELRTQMPLPFGTFDNDSRFFIGAVANVHWKSSAANDAVVIYLTWNLPFQKIAGVQQNTSTNK